MCWFIVDFTPQNEFDIDQIKWSFPLIIALSRSEFRKVESASENPR